jgi:Immunity protein Imm5
MRITTELVKSFNPCDDRFNNYKTNYPNSDLHIVDFLKLENITYSDKIWLWKKVATINEAALFGLKCAESVLHIFEEKYPNDTRPRQALESIKVYLDNPSDENKVKCRTAVTYATYAATYAAAYAAAHAAAHDAAYDAAAHAADAAADVTAEKQREHNLQFLIEIYEGK